MSRIRFVLAVGVSVLLVASAQASFVRSGPADPTGPPSPPNPLATYTGFPSLDPDDGKFMAVAGQNSNTLAGITVVAYVGLPAGTTSFEVSLFDGDTASNWDRLGNAPLLIYRFYKDRLKTGSTSDLVAQWSSSDATNDAWYTRTFSTDSGAQAPSGNYFYRLEANWQDASSDSFNNFKIRTTGQISLRAGQEFGFAGGPQRIQGFENAPFDPCVGSGDPNPGDTNDANANSYNGDWPWFFYVPTVLSSIAFRDGDSDRADDPNAPGAPQDDGTLYGACAEVHPSIFYTITDPDSHVFTNNNPSGNQEWEDFVIGPNPGDNVVINYPLQPGLWNLRVQGMDAHNFNVMRAGFEVYSTPDPPLTVNPTPEVEPDHEADTGGGETITFGHNVTNKGAPNSYDLKATSAHGWTTHIFHDTNGNGQVDAGELEVSMTPTLAQDEKYPLAVQVVVPGGIPSNLDDVTTVLASSRTEWAVQDDAKDTTHVKVNQKPNAKAGGPYVGPEGSPITFDAGGSFDPDGQPNPLTYSWDWDGDGVFDESSSSSIATHTWGDDLMDFPITLMVSDGDLNDTDLAWVTVTNVAPGIALTIVPTGDEAQSLRFEARLSDPGSDDLTYTWWGHCDGWSGTHVLFNEPSIGTDPDPSPDIHPRDEVVSETVVCGDDGTFEFHLMVEDDDAGVSQVDGTFDVSNLPPTLDVSPPSTLTVDEGTLVTISATATDPGSDDLAFSWLWQFGPSEARTYFNDGTGPDPDLSPGGTYPFTATDASSFTYGDDGSYVVGLTVADDDGGSLTYATTIEVRNVAPTVTAGPDRAVDEASPVTVEFAFSDPGFDQPDAGTVETFTGIIDWGYGAPDVVPVTRVPGGPGVPTTGTLGGIHVYGDNGVFAVTATVCDDDGGCGTATLTVTVRNLDPILLDVQAYVQADVTLRVAGEKWHDVRLDLVWNGGVTGTERIIRTPGSPDRQSGTITGGRLQLIGTFSIVVYYTPWDDPVNGQPNGANPVWVILRMPDGSEVRLHHTFNVNHPSTWVWTVDDFRPFLVGQRITFDATAHDPGSDDLTFAWDFGDGATVTTTFYNNGVSPDPYVSPEVSPITANDVQGHAFGGAGTYTITLLVTDDDGGAASRTVILMIG